MSDKELQRLEFCRRPFLDHPAMSLPSDGEVAHVGAQMASSMNLPSDSGSSADPGSPTDPGSSASSDSNAVGSRAARTVTKKELVARIADRTNQTKVVVKDVIQLFLDEIVGELAKGNRLEFREFGVFEIKERASRMAQNPVTMEKVHVPAKRVVKFKVGRLMRIRVAESSEPVTKDSRLTKGEDGSGGGPPRQ